MAKSARFLVYSDPHCPLIDPAAEAWVISKIREHRPDVIVLAGDLFEADSASRWPSECAWTLAEEFAAAAGHLARVRRAAPNATRIFVPGNHDDNIIALNRIDSKLRGLCDYRRAGNCDELHTHWQTGGEYTYHRTRGAYRLGQVVVSHGYEAGTNGDELESLYMANEYGLYVRGHTHRPCPVTQAQRTKAVPLRYWYANTGTIRQMDCDYMNRKRQAMWGSAVVVGEAELIKSPRMRRCWDAHTEIFRMFDDAE